MNLTSILRQTSRLALLLACSCCLSSCSMIGSLLSYVLSLPGAIFDAIVP